MVHNLAGFFVIRFFLGVTESGLFPGVVYYFSMWYKRSERQFRISLFFGGAALAGAFGGILAYVSLSRGVDFPWGSTRLMHVALGNRFHEGCRMAERLALDLYSGQYPT